VRGVRPAPRGGCSRVTVLRWPRRPSRPRGHAAPRALRERSGVLRRVRLRRDRYTGCKRTHVLLVACCLPRRMAPRRWGRAAGCGRGRGSPVSCPHAGRACRDRAWLAAPCARTPARCARSPSGSPPRLTPSSTSPPRGHPLTDLIEAFGQIGSAGPPVRWLRSVGPCWPLLTMLIGGLGSASPTTAADQQWKPRHLFALHPIDTMTMAWHQPATTTTKRPIASSALSFLN